MKTLIVGTSYVEDEARFELFKLWYRLVKHLNPTTDLMVVDTPGLFDPRPWLPTEQEIFRFDDNIGALSRGQRDGSGRGFCKGMEFAIERGYDYLVINEADFLFARPVDIYINRMHKAGVKVACTIATPYHFCEWGISFFDVKYLAETKFIERYGWEKTPFYPLPEWRVENMTAEDLFLFPLRGIRNDQDQINVGNLANSFPYQPPDWITHCRDLAVYFQFLNINRISLS
jgi:hypothetical protein